MYNHIHSDFLLEIRDLRDNPPGNDAVLGKFYAAVLELSGGESPLSALLSEVLQTRQITSKHLTNLMFRAYQYIKFAENDLAYQQFVHKEQWLAEILDLLSDESSYMLYRTLLLEKSTTTTIYQRYAGIHALTAHLFGRKPLHVADIGCGGNYGLRGIDLHEPFAEITDDTPNETVVSLLNFRMNLNDCLAIDRQNPEEEETRKWRLACMFYPKEIPTKPSVMAFEKRLSESKNVQFVQADIVSDGSFDNSYDAAILSTMLYQMSPKEQEIVLEHARSLIKPLGVIIVQDFARKSAKNPTVLDFEESWFHEPFSYRTFITSVQYDWKFLEVFQWQNGRCRAVRAGEDFDRIF